jgi:hypothetical protein
MHMHMHRQGICTAVLAYSLAYCFLHLLTDLLTYLLTYYSLPKGRVVRLLPAHRLRTFREWFLQLPEDQPPGGGAHPRGPRDSAPWIGPTETFRETNDLAYYVPPLPRPLLMSLGSEPSVRGDATPSAPVTPLRGGQARASSLSSLSSGGSNRGGSSRGGSNRGGSNRVAAESAALPGEASEGDSASEATPRPAPPREPRAAAARRHSERAPAARAMPSIAASPRSASDGAPGCGESPWGGPPQPATFRPMAVVRPTFATPLALAGAPRAVPPPAHPSPLLPMPRASTPLGPVPPSATSLQRLPLPSAAAGSLQPARPRPLPLPPVGLR